MRARWTTRCCSALALSSAFALAIVVRGEQLRPFPEPRPRSPRAVDQTPLSLFPVTTLWTLPLEASLTAPPAYDSTRAYFPLDGDRIVAYELAGGSQRWMAPIGTAITPAVGNDLLFIVLAESLAALRVSDGSVAWELPLAEQLAVPLVWDNGWLVAATTNGTVLAFRAADGHLIWRHDIGSAVHARPAFGADRLYVSTRDGRVVALRIETGAPVWEHRVGGEPTEILPLDERLYVGSTDNIFYCLHTADGREAWRWRAGADVIGAPVVDEHTVYFVALDNVLRALNRKSGVQRWKRALPLRPTAGPRMAAGTILVTGLAPTLRGYHAKDGTPAGEFAMAGELAAPPHILESKDVPLPMVIVVTRDIAKGATAVAISRSIEPPMTPVAPLPNLIPMAPESPTLLPIP